MDGVPASHQMAIGRPRQTKTNQKTTSVPRFMARLAPDNLRLSAWRVDNARPLKPSTPAFTMAVNSNASAQCGHVNVPEARPSNSTFNVQWGHAMVTMPTNPDMSG